MYLVRIEEARVKDDQQKMNEEVGGVEKALERLDFSTFSHIVRIPPCTAKMTAKLYVNN